MTERRHVLHVRSSIASKMPTSDDLSYGEIAINYSDGNEQMFVKSSTNNIRSFHTDDYLFDKLLPKTGGSITGGLSADSGTFTTLSGKTISGKFSKSVTFTNNDSAFVGGIYDGSDNLTVNIPLEKKYAEQTPITIDANKPTPIVSTVGSKWELSGFTVSSDNNHKLVMQWKEEPDFSAGRYISFINPYSDIISPNAISFTLPIESGTPNGSLSFNNIKNALGGVYAFAEGDSTSAIGDASHAEGKSTSAVGVNSHAEGNSTSAYGEASHTEGYYNMAVGECAHAEGGQTSAIGEQSHAECNHTIARGACSHAEGTRGMADGIYSHVEGNYTYAKGDSCHAEGNITKAYGYYAHSEGDSTSAFGKSSHAEGSGTTTSGESSHAEGHSTSAVGINSHAEGNLSVSNGNESHAEGYATASNGENSHTEGANTIAYNVSEHASGRFNISSSASTTFGDSGNTLFSVGNGTSATARTNAFEVRQNGDAYVKKNITSVAFLQSSDARSKENINSITDEEIEKSSKIELKSFNFKNDNRKHYGVIAQELQSIGLNELVNGSEETKYSVDYISLLILKIQELELRIKQLENK